MAINLNVLGALMEGGIICKEYSDLITTKHWNGLLHLKAKPIKQPMYPQNFRGAMGHGSVLCFCIRAGDHVLLVTWQSHKISPNIGAKIEGKLPVTMITDIVRV